MRTVRMATKTQRSCPRPTLREPYSNVIPGSSWLLRPAERSLNNLPVDLSAAGRRRSDRCGLETRSSSTVPFPRAHVRIKPWYRSRRLRKRAGN